MKNFLVKYYAPDGNSFLRNIKVQNAYEARELLIGEGYMPSVVLPNILMDMFRPLSNGGMKDRELSVFFLELHRLTYSAGSVNKAFGYMNKELKAPQKTDGFLKIIIYSIKKLYYEHKKTKSWNRRNLVRMCISGLEKGETLKDVLLLAYFDEITLSLSDMAVSTGDYPQIFLKISEYFETKANYRKNLTGALIYPLFLIFLLIAAFSVFLYYVIPSFAIFFSQFPRIPASTDAVLSFFSRLKSIFLYLIFILIAIFGFIKSDLFGIKNRMARIILNIPQLRNSINYGYLNWFFYQFSLMISSGITLASIFAYFKKNTGNAYFKEKFELVHLKLTEGSTLRDALSEADFLNEEAVEAIEYAEISGFLPEAIIKLSEEYKNRSEDFLRLFTKTLFFSAMALVVVFLFIMFFSLLLPLINGMVSLPNSY